MMTSQSKYGQARQFTAPSLPMISQSWSRLVRVGLGLGLGLALGLGLGLGLGAPLTSAARGRARRRIEAMDFMIVDLSKKASLENMGCIVSR